MPCFIRVIQRLGIKLPIDPMFNDWLERELMREFNADTPEELRTTLIHYEMYRPEELKEVIRRLRKIAEEAKRGSTSSVDLHPPF